LAFPLAAAAQAAVQAVASTPEHGKKASGTEQQGDQLRLEVRRVPVDVVVTDKQGNAVRGLRKADFVVKEDKTTQTVLSFDYFDGSKPSFVPLKLPALPPNTYINLPGEPERGPLCVLYYDMVNTLPEDQMTFHQQLLDFVDKAAPGTRIALFVNAAGLHLIQGFTSDHALLHAAILSKGPGPHLPAVFLYGESYGRRDTVAAASSLQFLAEYLGGIAGRKNLIWLSGKFPLPYGPFVRPMAGYGATTKTADVMRKAVAAMMRSQVAVYPVDVKGVVVWEERSPIPSGDTAPDFSSVGNPSAAPGGSGAGGSGAAGGGGAGGSGGGASAAPGHAGGQSGFSVTAADQFQEEYIAKATGGHAYYSNNDVSGVMEKAVELGQSYYTLSYEPTNTTFDGSARHIEVTLENKGAYTLSYRNLYYAVPDDADETTKKPDTLQARFVAAKATDTLFANIEHGTPMLHDLIFSVHLAAVGEPVLATAEQMLELEDSPAFFRARHRDRPLKPLPPVKLQKYRIDYVVIDPQLKELAARAGKPPVLEFAAAAYDDDGLGLNSIFNKGLASAGPQANGKAGPLFRAEQELEAPPGVGWIRVAVRDTLSNQTGTFEVRLPLKPEPVTVAASKSN
jgi:VWFA-related protein